MQNENRRGSTLSHHHHVGERGIIAGWRIVFQPRFLVILFIFNTHSNLYFRLNYKKLPTRHRLTSGCWGRQIARRQDVREEKGTCAQAANFLIEDMIKIEDMIRLKKNMYHSIRVKK